MRAFSSRYGDGALFPPERRIRVLLVEDDQADRMAIERHVLREGLSIVLDSAASGAEAVRKLRGATYDVVLLDYILGDMTGLELLPELGDIAAIFITGMGNEEIAANAIRLGADDYLVKDPDRSYLQLLPVVIRTVLSRKQAQATLKESQRQLATLMGNLPGMAYRSAPGAPRRMEFVSAGCLELTGFGAESLVQRQQPAYLDLVLAEDREAMRAAVDDALQRRNPFECTYRIQPREGAVKWVWERGAGILGPGGELLAVEGFVSDITTQKTQEAELRLAKEQAEAAIRLKDRFVSLVAHDLRAPLSTCVLTAQTLRRELLASGPQTLSSGRAEELFGVLRTASAGMLRLIDELLLSNRLKSGAVQPAPRFIGEHTLRRKLEELADAARRKDIALAMDLPPNFRLYADPDLLGEVLQNLLHNAIKFSPRGSTVEVFVPAEGGASLAVRDRGMGLPPGVMERIQQGELVPSSPGTDGEKGSGLGLELCHEILRAHRGTLSAQSLPGAGTVMALHLPAMQPVVLAVDLRPADLEALRVTLRSVEVLLETVGSTAEALERMLKAPVHLAVTDRLSPRAGASLVAKIRGSPQLRELPLWMLDPAPSQRDAQPAEPRPDEVLAMPLEPQQVLHFLPRYLGG